MRLHGTDASALSLLFSKEEIATKVGKLAGEISRDYSGKELLLVVVLNGAFIFAADLVRMLNLPLELDFVTLKSYRGMESRGRVKITRDLEIDARGKHLLVVEDIIDTGVTLGFLLNHLAGKYPKSLKVCAMVDKRGRRRNDIMADYAGVVCETGFLVGYGLDLDEKYRELDAIYEVAELPPYGGLNDNTM